MLSGTTGAMAVPTTSQGRSRQQTCSVRHSCLAGPNLWVVGAPQTAMGTLLDGDDPGGIGTTSVMETLQLAMQPAQAGFISAGVVGSES